MGLWAVKVNTTLGPLWPKLFSSGEEFNKSTGMFQVAKISV